VLAAVIQDLHRHAAFPCPAGRLEGLLGGEDPAADLVTKPGLDKLEAHRLVVVNDSCTDLMLLRLSARLPLLAPAAAVSGGRHFCRKGAT
jgi:hypothetical protein